MKEKIADTEDVTGLVEQLLNGEVCFGIRHYMPEDVFHQEPCCLKVRGTLQGYEKDFGKPYRRRPGNQFVPYWDLDKKEWCTFRCVNLMTKQEED